MAHVPEELNKMFKALNVDRSPWAGCLKWELTREMLPELRVRSTNVLFDVLKLKTIGDLFALDVATVLGARQSGVKTCVDVDRVRTKVFLAGPDAWQASIVNIGAGIAELPSSISREDEVPEAVLLRMSKRANHVLLSILPHPTIGGLCDLTRQRIGEQKGAGKKVVEELMSLRLKFVKGEDLAESEEVQLGASDFASLADLIVSLDGTGKEQVRIVLRDYLGLLNVTERQTLEACGKTLGVTRERVRQIAANAEKRLFGTPRQKAFDELESVVRSSFETAANRELRPGKLLADVNSSFGWSKTTEFSLLRLLESLGWKIVVLPEERGLGWNEDGRFDWVKGYKEPTLTDRRHAAIQKVLTDAGYTGLSLSEIVAICKRDYPELKIGEGNVKGAMNGDLDLYGARIIPYDRGTRANGGTRYSLNSFFRDKTTKDVLEKTARRIKAYMETTGLGVVSVWKACRDNASKLPRPLPTVGFYMMMRDFGSGGLVYQDYPRIAHPGIKIVENTFHWMLYEYCTQVCMRRQATFAEIMYFFTECLGIQPSIALTCAFCSMGLKKIDDDEMKNYRIKAPAKGVLRSSLLLPAISKFSDFSLINLPAKAAVSKYYLDENGRALAVGPYVKLFFRALEEKKFSFPEDELAGLQDKEWCKKHLKSYHAVLRPAGAEKKPSAYGYWRERFDFGGIAYFVSDDWEARNKAKFDDWAIRIAAKAGIPFEPYEVFGMKHHQSDSDNAV